MLYPFLINLQISMDVSTILDVIVHRYLLGNTFSLLQMCIVNEAKLLAATNTPNLVFPFLEFTTDIYTLSCPPGRLLDF